MKLPPRTGVCAACGEDWDLGDNSSPPYDNCTCDSSDASEEQDEAYARAESAYRDLDRGEL